MGSNYIRIAFPTCDHLEQYFNKTHDNRWNRFQSIKSDLFDILNHECVNIEYLNSYLEPLWQLLKRYVRRWLHRSLDQYYRLSLYTNCYFERTDWSSFGNCCVKLNDFCHLISYHTFNNAVHYRNYSYFVGMLRCIHHGYSTILWKILFCLFQFQLKLSRWRSF